MPSQLCEICLSIVPRFWSEELDDKGFPWGPRVKLQPFKSMQAAAARGCQLCQILLASAQVDFLDEWTLEKIKVTLARAIIDGHQGVCLTVGNDDRVDNFQIMKTWIQECRQNHEICLQNLTNFLPTRLLDLRNMAGSGRADIVSHWGPLSWPAVRALNHREDHGRVSIKLPTSPFAGRSSPSRSARVSRSAFSFEIYSFSSVKG